MFNKGDAVLHPVRGAGVVAGLEEREWRESPTPYYKIALMDPPGTDLWIPASKAEEIGLRLAISRSELDQIWRVLTDDPQLLPDDHKERQAFLDQHVSSGNALRIAAALRDISWRRKQRKLRAASEHLYEKGMMLLGGELAVAQSIAMSEAENQIHARLSEMGDFSPS